jgi:hypothetical protein
LPLLVLVIELRDGDALGEFELLGKCILNQEETIDNQKYISQF